MGKSHTTVLLVEDNALNQYMLTRRLEKTGFRVINRVNGQDILEAVEEVRPAAILLDMQLPGIDGWHLARTLKANTRTAAIPVIAVTAYAMPGDREKCLEAGCDAYICKPIDFTLLLQTIQTLLEQHTSVRDC